MKSLGERTSSQTSSGEKIIHRSLVHAISQKIMTTSSSLHATETHGLRTPCRELRSKTKPTKISTTTDVVAGNQAIFPQEISTVLENIRSRCRVGGSSLDQLAAIIGACPKTISKNWSPTIEFGGVSKVTQSLRLSASCRK